MAEIKRFIIQSFEHLLKEHPEGVFFYLLGSLIMTIVLIRNRNHFKKGLEGANGLWEAPEIVTYLWLWMFPQSILAVLFLELTPPDMFWYFMLGCLLFALAGRTGIEMLFNWRGSKIIEKESSTKETTITNENKDS
jgi:hypothetical protein